MKKIFVLLLSTSLIMFLSCSKDFIQVNATIEKNCTGSYLKVDDKFFFVCNADKIANYTNGQTISVSYGALEGCKSQQTANCDLNFNNDGVIEIKEIL